jgi:hypothetical protein
MIYQSISQIGDFLALSNANEDYLAIDPSRCSGGGDADQRTSVEDAPGQDGALILPPLDGAQIITIAGDLVVTSTGHSAEPGYFDAVEALRLYLKTALDALKTAPGDLVHSGGTLKVWKYGKLEDSWPTFWVCSVTFSIVVDVNA